MNVTVINAGQAHNKVPAECAFVVDIRLNEYYTHEEVLAIIRANVKCEVKERSTRVKSKGVSLGHPIVKVAQALGFELYGSPTTSDQALMPFPSVKLGPGDSARSHSADEFIFVGEIEKGIEKYIALLSELKL
jgi:acetylornithine deacetylase